MIKIDENNLRDDLLYTLLVLCSYPNRNFVNRNYKSFLNLYSSYSALFGKQFVLEDPKSLVPAEMYCILNEPKEFNEYINKVKRNIVPIINCSASICDLMIDLDFYGIYYYDVIRKYSEADFKDLILGYYSTYGNDYYKIAKKYFDESRIQFGANNPIIEKSLEDDYDEEEDNQDPIYLYDGQIKVKDLLENIKIQYEESNENEADNSELSEEDEVSMASITSGFFSSLQWLESGYIFNLKNKYNSSTACNIVHELGHAIDAEKFRFPQKKKIAPIGDIFSEIPSLAMEYGFFDYLKDNRIDVDGSRIIKNSSEESLFIYAIIIFQIINNPEYNIGYNGDVYDNNNKKLDLRDSVLYGIGNYMALHLNQIRRSDPKEYLRVYNDLMTLRGEATYKQLIEMAGFDYDKYTSGYYIKNEIENDFLELKKRYGH